jgi:hypothetical protein
MPIRIIDKARDREEASVKDKKKKSKLKELKGDVESSTAAYKMLVGGQAKLDKNKNNKIDAEDFKILKAEKAKGRGQGLQDEKMKPGKVMKAKRGMRIKKDPTKTVNPFEKKSSKFLERRKKLQGIKKGLGKAGRIGAAITALGIAGAGAAKVGQTIGRKMSEKKNKKMGGGMMKRPAMKKGGMSAGDKFNAKIKGMLDSYDDKKTPMKKDRIKQKLKASGKMGGGMMQRPGYNVGGSVTVKTKLGRNKPTKMF